MMANVNKEPRKFQLLGCLTDEGSFNEIRLPVAQPKTREPTYFKILFPFCLLR